MSFAAPLPSHCFYLISQCYCHNVRRLPYTYLLNIPVRPLTKSSVMKITDTPHKMPPCSPVVWIDHLTTTVRKDCSPKFNSDRFWRTTVPVWKVRARVHFVLCGLPGLHRTVNVLRKHRVCAACCCIVLECWLCILINFLNAIPLIVLYSCNSISVNC